MRLSTPLLTTVALFVVAIGATCGATAQEAKPAERLFGAAPTIDRAAAVTVSQVVGDSSRQGPTVLVAGTIADVCTAKGCWLVVTDGSRQMRVMFKDYAFFVPKDIFGQHVLLQ